MTKEQFLARVNQLAAERMARGDQPPSPVMTADTSDVTAYPSDWWRYVNEPDAIEGTGEVEFRTVEAADQDEREGWADATGALDCECRERFNGATPKRWIYTGRNGRWVTFEAR